MIVELNDIIDSLTNEKDICIIGAGPVGICLAIKLARLGREVLLLESGGRHHESFAQELYSGTTEGLNFDGLSEGRFRGVGGTSTQWGGQILEIDEHIFPNRPWIEGSGWLFNKDELQPFYDEAIEYEGLKDSITDPKEIWKKREISPLDLGEHFIHGISSWCQIRDFSDLYRNELKTLPNLTLALHANVTEFKLNSQRNKITSIICRHKENRAIEIKASIFVLCTGGIETSRLLLFPISDGKLAPWQVNDQVGRFFQDHLVANIATVKPINLTDPDKFFDYFSLNGWRYHPKLKLSSMHQEQLKMLDVGGTVTFVTNGVDDLSQAFVTIKSLKSRRFDKLNFHNLTHLMLCSHKLLWHKIPLMQKLMKATKTKSTTLSLVAHCEQSPLSDSIVRLSDQKDKLGLPQVHLEWRLSNQELHSLRSYALSAKKAFESKGLAEIEIDKRLLDCNTEFTSEIKEGHHHIGGARMSLSPKDGVVDINLKIHDMTNTYICSSAVFPCTGFVNPTHTTIALALRLADHLNISTF